MTATVITIDGTSGVGKGTLARELSSYFHGTRLDSGAIYRASGLYLNMLGYNLDQLEGDSLISACEQLQRLPLEFKPTATGELEILLADQVVTKELRLETTGLLASKIATIPAVRQALLARQRQFATDYPLLIAEGRDMGTVIFPTATVKIYLDASPEVKAQRRFDELVAKGEQVDYEAILASLNQRDAQDSQRKTAPLKPAADAHIIDTSNLDISQVTAQAIAICASHGIVPSK